MPMSLGRDELIARLVRAGELEVSGEDPGAVTEYFDVDTFRFHGPDGFESDFAGLNDYFAAIRQAFDNRSYGGESCSSRAVMSPARPGSKACSCVTSRSHPRPPAAVPTGWVSTWGPCGSSARWAVTDSSP